MKEDTYLFTYGAIEKLLGTDVALAFRRLTKEPKEGYHERIEMFGNILDLMVKCIDRLHNMRTLGNRTPAKIAKQIKETHELYIPLAQRLTNALPEQEKWRGVYLHSELESLCRKHEQNLAKAELAAEIA